MSRILLIEDNHNNAEYMIRILESAGHEVQHCVQGLEGVKVARATPHPELILLDFNLPDIDGSILILTLKRQLGGASAPPFVAVTARTSNIDRRLAERFGFDAFISKPFEPEELLTVVTDFLNP